MGRLLDKVSFDDPAFRVELDGDGVVLVRNDAHTERFNALARDLINSDLSQFLVLPTADGRAGYERIYILPI